MYKCQQCGEKAEVQNKDVVCAACDYTVSKDIIDKDDLLEAAEEIVSDFNRFGTVLQEGDNGEYGTSSAIGQLASAVSNANLK